MEELLVHAVWDFDSGNDRKTGSDSLHRLLVGGVKNREECSLDVVPEARVETLPGVDVTSVLTLNRNS